MAKRNFIPLVPSGTINADASVAQLEQDVLAMDAKVGELAEDIGDTEQEINQLKSHLSDFTISPDNINKWNPAEAVANTTLSQAQATLGNLVNLSGYTTSGFIAVKNNDVVRWDYLTNEASHGAFMGRGTSVYRIGEFDSDKNCLLVTENWTALPYTVQNANTAFIRICVETKGTNSVMIGNTSTAQTYYIPYRDLDVNAAYPFEPDDYPIKEIVFERYVSNKIAVIEIDRNFNINGGTYVYAIVFFDFITNTKLLILNVAASSYTEESRVDFNLSSGYKGHLIIDWSAIPDGGQIRNTWQISQAAFAFANTLSTYQYPSVYPYTKLSDCPIYDIRFTEYDPTKTYYIDDIGRNVNPTPVHYVRLRDSDNNTYLLLNILSSNYTEKAENSFSKGSYGNAGLSGAFWIDWSKIPEGTHLNFGKPQLSPLCMALSDVNINALGTGIKVVVPSTIHAVQGHPFSLYFANIFQNVSFDGYYCVVSPANSNAENMGDRIRFSCASVGDTAYTISLRNYKQEILVSKGITVSVHAESIPDIKAIFIGDSFVDAGKMQAELKNLMGEHLTLYGTRSSNTTDSQGVTQTILDEGRSSWSLANYTQLSEKSGVTNAFWDGSKFNFSYYMTQNPSFADATDVFILSGPNDYGPTLADFANQYQTIVDSIKSFSDTIRIHLLMPLTQNCDGYAWGVRNYGSAYNYRYSMFDFGQTIINTFTDAEQCYVVPTHVYFSKDYNFPTTIVAVNDRTPTTITVFNDNVHPNEYGYFSMADIIFGDIVANCQSE